MKMSEIKRKKATLWMFGRLQSSLFLPPWTVLWRSCDYRSKFSSDYSTRLGNCEDFVTILDDFIECPVENSKTNYVCSELVWVLLKVSISFSMETGR
jgi:hypothetical protein